MYALAGLTRAYDPVYSFNYSIFYYFVIGFFIIHYGYILICKIFKMRAAFHYNFMLACLFMVMVIVLAYVYFSLSFVLLGFITQATPIEGLFTNLFFYFLCYIFSTIFFVYTNVSFSKKRREYYKVAIAFNVMFSFLSILYFYFLASIGIYLNVALTLSLLIPLIAVFVGINCHYIIGIFNISTEKQFFNFKNNLKIFVTNLFKKDAGYLIGIFFIIVMGILYIVGAQEDKYLKYVGYFFLIMSCIRIADFFWMRFTKKEEKKKRFMHQYIMMIVNALFISLTIFLIYKVVTNARTVESGGIDFFTFVFASIIVARIIIVVINFYHSRINVKKEPYFITLNNLAIISLIISMYAFIISIMVNVGVDTYDLHNVMNIFSHSIIAIVIIIVVIMLIRAIVGIVRIKKIEEVEA